MKNKYRSFGLPHSTSSKGVDTWKEEVMTYLVILPDSIPHTFGEGGTATGDKDGKPDRHTHRLVLFGKRWIRNHSDR